MAEDISRAELYRIINRAVALCTNHEDKSVDAEIAIFRERYFYRLQNNRQLSVFEETPPVPEDLAAAEDFCRNLEAYRSSADIFAKENPDLTEKQYRGLNRGIERFRPIISENNRPMLNALEYNVRRHLPEYKDELILAEYNQKACRIGDMKRGYNRLRRQNQPASKDYEIEALHFFKDVLDNEELKKIKGSPEKLKLYDNCLKIVDCLPPDRYGRIAKFKLKRDFNYAIRLTATGLEKSAATPEQAKSYQDMAKKAAYEEERYLTAMDRAKAFADKPQPLRKSKDISTAARNKRAFDEWYYR